MTKRPIILCVDDEPQVLAALSLNLGDRYRVLTATSGALGLEQLRAHPDTMGVVSDMRMPGMNGAQFLAASRALVPDARRILLTGHAQMDTAVAAVNEGQIFRFLSKPCAPPVLLGAIESAVADYQSQLAERQSTQRNARREALLSDAQTGLASREGLAECVALILAERVLEQFGAGLYVFEVSLPPSLTAGASACMVDDPWVQLAARLRVAASGAACIARCGFRTFAVLERLPVGTSARILLQRAESLLAELREPITVDSASIGVTVAAGVASMPPEVGDAASLLNRAELALRVACTSGDGAVTLFDDELAAQEQYRCTALGALRRAIADDRLELHYQPVVNVPTRQVHALEALARWSDPELGEVPPSVFVPLAESAGLAVALGDWVLRRACRDARLLAGEDAAPIAVNVSVVQLLAPDFFDKVVDLLAENRLPARALALEVTESVFARDLDLVASQLARARELGIRVAIDDFGTGYSSLAYLHRLPADSIKIDGIFSRDFDAGGEAIIHAAIGIARNLDLEIIVEGIETPEMIAQALGAGAVLMQGFAFAKPMPLESLPAWRAEFTQKDR